MSSSALATAPSGPGLAWAERDLVLGAQAGDRDATNELVLRHRRACYLFALQLVRHREDAMDVVQDALVKFLTHLDRFDPDRPLKPWLFSIVRNQARDALRRRKVRRAAPLEAETDDDEPGVLVIDESPGPEQSTARGELRRLLWARLGQLPAAQREILVLRDYQDLSYAEIAQVLEIPLGTVMSRLHRARKHLRDLLVDELGERDLP